MDAFGDEPPAVEVPAGDDPAADFLAREQEELGDLGQELGIDATSPSEPVEEIEEIQAEPEPALSDGMQGMKLSSPFEEVSLPRVEPETIRVWRAEQEKRLREKDEKEEAKMSEMREQAKRDLTDW